MVHWSSLSSVAASVCWISLPRMDTYWSFARLKVARSLGSSLCTTACTAATSRFSTVPSEAVTEVLRASALICLPGFPVVIDHELTEKHRSKDEIMWDWLFDRVQFLYKLNNFLLNCISLKIILDLNRSRERINLQTCLVRGTFALWINFCPDLLTASYLHQLL